MLLAQTKNGEVLAIAGVVEGTDGDKLRFRYQDKTRTISLKQVEGVIMASRPESRQPDELRPTFTLPDSVAISGEWKDLDTATWKIETRWGQELNLPAAEVLDVKFRGGKVTFLSDLTPAKVEETPYFGHRLPWRRDVKPAGRAAQDQRPELRSRARRPFAMHPHLRPAGPLFSVRGARRL